MRAIAVIPPGMFLSQPPTTSTPSIAWPFTLVSIASAITSRDTSEYFIASVPMPMPSVMVGTPNTCGIAPASFSAAIARSTSGWMPALHGFIVECPFATPTIGLSKSVSPKPTARSMARFGERATPPVMVLERQLLAMSASSCRAKSLAGAARLAQGAEGAVGHRDARQDECEARQVVPPEPLAEQQVTERRPEHRHQMGEERRPRRPDAVDAEIERGGGDDRGEDRAVGDARNRLRRDRERAAPRGDLPDVERDEAGEPERADHEDVGERRQLQRSARQEERVERPRHHRDQHQQVARVQLEPDEPLPLAVREDRRHADERHREAEPFAPARPRAERE